MDKSKETPGILSFDLRIKNFINKAHQYKADIKQSFKRLNKQALISSFDKFINEIDSLTMKQLCTVVKSIIDKLNEMDFFPDDFFEPDFLALIELVETECNNFSNETKSANRVGSKNQTQVILATTVSGSASSPQTKKKKNTDDFLSQFKGFDLEKLYYHKDYTNECCSKEISSIKSKYSKSLTISNSPESRRRKSIMSTATTVQKEEEDVYPFKQEKFECLIF